METKTYGKCLEKNHLPEYQVEHLLSQNGRYDVVVVVVVVVKLHAWHITCPNDE